MKYRHAFHAGNFADVHKHVALLALLEALARKPRGYLYVDTHAGRGLYDLDSSAARESREAHSGVNALLHARSEGRLVASQGLTRYLDAVTAVRAETGLRHGCPGSPLLAARVLRAVDRAVLIESDTLEFVELGRALRGWRRISLENSDGFARLPALLPPPERRALVLIDPPFEETRLDFQRIGHALTAALEKLAHCVIAVWYPIKIEADMARWHRSLAERLGAEQSRETLISELYRYPPDSRAGLNGSGLLIVNPPYLLEGTLREDVAALAAALEPGLGAAATEPGPGSWSVRQLGASKSTA